MTYFNGQVSWNLKFFDEINIIINKLWSHHKIMKLKQSFPSKENLRLNRLWKNYLKILKLIYLRMKQLVVIYHLTSINESTFICFCLARCIKEDLVKSDFPDSLNLSNIIPIQENEDPAGQITYRSVSVLSLVSKIFDKIM